MSSFQVSLNNFFNYLCIFVFNDFTKKLSDSVRLLEISILIDKIDKILILILMEDKIWRSVMMSVRSDSLSCH